MLSSKKQLEYYTNTKTSKFRRKLFQFIVTYPMGQLLVPDLHPSKAALFVFLKKKFKRLPEYQSKSQTKIRA